MDSLPTVAQQKHVTARFCAHCGYDVYRCHITVVLEQQQHCESITCCLRAKCLCPACTRKLADVRAQMHSEAHLLAHRSSKRALCLCVACRCRCSKHQAAARRYRGIHMGKCRQCRPLRGVGDRPLIRPGASHTGRTSWPHMPCRMLQHFLGGQPTPTCSRC